MSSPYLAEPIDVANPVVRSSDLLAALLQQVDAATVIVEAQRVAGASIQLDDTKTKVVWSDWQALVLFAGPSGLYGFGSSAYGFFA